MPNPPQRPVAASRSAALQTCGPKSGALTRRRYRAFGGALLLIALASSSPMIGSAGAPNSSEFDVHPVYRFEIELRPAERTRLENDSRQYVPADVRIDGIRYGQLGIHLKGSGSFRGLSDKPSFTLNFRRFDSKQLFCGVHKIHLNNSVEDASYLREWIGTELFRSAGVPAPRVAHAVVELNGRPLGLYVLKEGFTREFLSREFSAGDGHLYERNLPSDSTLRALALAAQEPDLHRRWCRLEDALEIERFVSFIAMEVVTAHWDGYGLARNNFRLYHDPGRDKLVFLPTGMDQLFANPKLTWRPHMAGLAARALLETPEGQAQYRTRVEALLATKLCPAFLAGTIHEKLATLRPAVSAQAFASMGEEAARLCRQIAQRYEFLKSELGLPEPKVLAVPAGGTLLTNWSANDVPRDGGMSEDLSADGKPAWHIVAGPRTSASWRAKVRLAGGQYRLEARVRTRAVTELPFGRNHGARLRVGGTAQKSAAIVGTRDWEWLQVQFEVAEPEAEVELICELRAGGGEAWFDSQSLFLVL